MGWKSTLTLSRETALATIMGELAKIHLKSNTELGDLMDEMFGDDIERPYYGHNFLVVDKLKDED